MPVEALGEALANDVAELRHGVVRHAVEGVEPLLAPRDDAFAAQRGEVLGDGWLSKPDALCELQHRTFSAQQFAEDAQPRGIPEQS